MNRQGKRDKGMTKRRKKSNNNNTITNKVNERKQREDLIEDRGRNIREGNI